MLKTMPLRSHWLNVSGLVTYCHRYLDICIPSKINTYRAYRRAEFQSLRWDENEGDQRQARQLCHRYGSQHSLHRDQDSTLRDTIAPSGRAAGRRSEPICFGG